jgi:hypothetical protein
MLRVSAKMGPGPVLIFPTESKRLQIVGWFLDAFPEDSSRRSHGIGKFVLMQFVFIRRIPL